MLYENYRMLLLYVFAITLLVAVEYSRPVTETYIIIQITEPKDVEFKEEPKVKPVVTQKIEAEKVKIAAKPPEKKKVIPAPQVKKEVPITKDTYLLAQIINAEAKGEPYNGKVAVGNVVMNRVKHPDFPDTLQGVIFQKGQFQPVSNGTIYNKPDEEALKAAKEVMNGKQIVGSQTIYFYNPDIATSNWIFSRPAVIEIGNHIFAK